MKPSLIERLGDPELPDSDEPRPPPKWTSPILPGSGVPGRTLTVIVAVMSYLACLSLGALIVINKSIDAWTSDISRQVTVQVRPVVGIDVDNEIAKAAAILRDTEGVSGHTVLSAQAAAALLEPWLGSTAILEELPVPRIIEVGIDVSNPPDLDRLGERLDREVVGASLDTHRRWQAQLLRTGGTLKLVGYGVLFLISITTVAIVVFGTRAALDANRQIVEVLHLVGARDGFIAREVQRHFLYLGLTGGLIGAGAGIVTFAVMSWFASPGAGASLSYASETLLSGTHAFGFGNYLTLLAVPAAATLITIATARLAVMRMLAEVL